MHKSQPPSAPITLPNSHGRSVLSRWQCVHCLFSCSTLSPRMGRLKGTGAVPKACQAGGHPCRAEIITLGVTLTTLVAHSLWASLFCSHTCWGRASCHGCEGDEHSEGHCWAPRMVGPRSLRTRLWPPWAAGARTRNPSVLPLRRLGGRSPVCFFGLSVTWTLAPVETALDPSHKNGVLVVCSPPSRTPGRQRLLGLSSERRNVGAYTGYWACDT